MVGTLVCFRAVELETRAKHHAVFLSVVNGEAEQVDFIDSSVTEEEEEEIRIDPTTQSLVASLPVQSPPPLSLHVLLPDILSVDMLRYSRVYDGVFCFQEQKETTSSSQTQGSPTFR